MRRALVLLTSALMLGGLAVPAAQAACGDTYPEGTRPPPWEVCEAAPSLETATMWTQASRSVPLGGSIFDTATVVDEYLGTEGSGFFSYGSVTFNVYGPDDETCSGPSVSTSTTRVIFGRATSTRYTPVAAGTYRFTAAYDGAGVYRSIDPVCNEPNESTVVTRTSTVATRASSSVVVGGTVSDSATVTAGNGPAPTGNVTFTAYGPDDAACERAAAFSSTQPLTDGTASSGSFSPVTEAGTYRFVARYWGDAATAPSTGRCGDAGESVVVDKATPTLSTSATPSADARTPITDTATLSGYHPTGVLTFSVYSPADESCSAEEPWSSAVLVDGDGSYTSSAYTPQGGGSYRWIARYAGDANNLPVEGECNAAGETTVVTPIDPPAGTVTITDDPITPANETSVDVVVSREGARSTWASLYLRDTDGHRTDDQEYTFPAGSSASHTFLVDASGLTDGLVWAVVTFYEADGAEETSTAVDDATKGVQQEQLAAASEEPSAAASQEPSAGPTASSASSATAPFVASPSPSASASPRVTSPAARQRLTLAGWNTTIRAGSTGTLIATGAPNEAYELRCYTRPSTTYVTSRTGSFNAAGDAVEFVLSLGRNTRCFIRYATNVEQGASDSVFVDVRTVLSLSTVRTDTRTYVFQGRNLPRVPGQLITLYRIDSSGTEVRTANLYSDDSGTYRMTRRFVSGGTYRFVVRTTKTWPNVAGSSNTVTLNVR